MAVCGCGLSAQINMLWYIKEQCGEGEGDQEGWREQRDPIFLTVCPCPKVLAHY